MFKPLKIALASYDRKELRVQKHYLEEEGAPISCTCFLSGERLFRCLQQDHSFDVAILCNEMEDMTGLEFMEHIRALEQRPVLRCSTRPGATTNRPCAWKRRKGSSASSRQT